MIDPDLPTETLTMWRADVIVLFDWLMSTDLNTVPITHPAQKQALADLLTCIEGDADVSRVSQDDIDEASRAVAADMGW